MDKSVDCECIKRSKKQRIPPDSDLPPHWSSHQHWIKRVAVPMNDVDTKWGWPQRIFEVARVFYYELFDIDDVRDHSEVDDKKCQKEQVQRSF